jgi:hypothetical protein
MTLVHHFDRRIFILVTIQKSLWSISLRYDWKSKDVRYNRPDSFAKDPS